MNSAKVTMPLPFIRLINSARRGTRSIWSVGLSFVVGDEQEVYYVAESILTVFDAKCYYRRWHVTDWGAGQVDSGPQVSPIGLE